jgi:hypothetical protein
VTNISAACTSCAAATSMRRYRELGDPIRLCVSGGEGAASPSISMSSAKRFSVELYAQAFNLFNHTNLSNFAGVQTSPFFGHATSAQLPRRMELGMRFNF